VPRLDEVPVGSVLRGAPPRVESGLVSVCSRGMPQLGPPKRLLSRVAVLEGVLSAIKRQSNQNWHGPGESDCLIKTKHCDGRRAVLTQCDFCPVL
jgi:hypothetical protein